jgi:hypothetical protein
MAALWISGDGEYQVEDDSIRVQLLHDIRRVLDPNLFELDPKARYVPSASVVLWLVELQERPWPTFRRGRELTQFQLASMLRPYGVKPLQYKSGGKKERGYRVKGYTNSLQAAFDRYLPPVEQDPEDHDDDHVDDASVCSDPPPFSGASPEAEVPAEETSGSQADFDAVPKKPGTGSKTHRNPSTTAKGNGASIQNPENEGGSEHTRNGASNEPSISANSDKPGAALPNGSDSPAAPPNGATDGFIFSSVEEGARHYMALHPGWSLARIANELAVPLDRIEELFPDRSALVAKVRSALAEDPNLTAEQISKRVKRPRSAVERALRVIGQ